jgi:hypothetical protein
MASATPRDTTATAIATGAGFTAVTANTREARSRAVTAHTAVAAYTAITTVGPVSAGKNAVNPRGTLASITAEATVTTNAHCGAGGLIRRKSTQTAGATGTARPAVTAGAAVGKQGHVANTAITPMAAVAAQTRYAISAHRRSSTADTRIAAVTAIAASATIAAVTDSKIARHTRDAHRAIHPSTTIAAVATDTLCACG